MKKLLLAILPVLCLVLSSIDLKAQGNLSFEGVRSVYIRNSGQIMEREELKGYFVFYVSDKVDRHTNEYTIQITDNNLNKIKEIKFEDDKNIQVLESSYNGNSIMFLFYNAKEKTLEYRAYGFDGKVKSSYTKELNKRSNALLQETYGTKSEEGQNEALFSVGDQGYTTVFPVKEGKYYSYEVNFFYTSQKKQWSYEAAEEQEDKYAAALYLGATDSLVLFEVVKKPKLMSGKIHSFLLALNIFTGKKEFEITTEFEDFKFYPMNISTLNGKSDFMLMGTYTDKGDNVTADNTLGLAVYTMNSKGTVTSKKYNSWENDFSKYLTTDSKGKIKKIGYLYFHKLIQTSDGKIFAIGEGYRKVADGMGIAMNVLGMLGGGGGRSNNTMMQTTDLIFIQFNDKFGLESAKVYDKHNNNCSMPLGADYVSPHKLALLIRAQGGFDYDFTQTDNEHTRFSVGYDDYERSDNYKGKTFNSISYAGGNLTTDKIELTSKAKWLKIFPAKTGYVMLMEYFKKDKKLDLRLEKLN